MRGIVQAVTLGLCYLALHGRRKGKSRSLPVGVTTPNSIVPSA